jgi:hypothetical protein
MHDLSPMVFDSYAQTMKEDLVYAVMLLGLLGAGLAATLIIMALLAPS